jgi:hypothetical protein
LYTDIYLPKKISALSPLFGRAPAIKALMCRNHEELPFSLVEQECLTGISFRKKIRKTKGLAERQDLLCKYGNIFSQQVAARLSPGENLIGFSGQSLEAFRRTKELGGTTILDQVDPGLSEWKLVDEEAKKYADWSAQSAGKSWSEKFQRRIENEMRLADYVIVNSDYSKRAITDWIGEKRFITLPIASAVSRKEPTTPNIAGALNVLFLGGLSLRKGVHYALEAVHNLNSKGVLVNLILVGEMFIDPDKLAEFKGNTYLGTKSATDIADLLDSVDVLLFPTLSDGYGMVQVEAVSRGIPVIASRRCAEIVQHEKSGFLLEEVSVEAIQKYLTIYYENRGLLHEHAKHAFKSSSEFTIDKYSEMVFESLSSLEK